jgi:hypothetical protein
MTRNDRVSVSITSGAILHAITLVGNTYHIITTSFETMWKSFGQELVTLGELVGHDHLIEQLEHRIQRLTSTEPNRITQFDVFDLALSV